MTVLVAGRLTPTNVALLDAFRAFEEAAGLFPLDDVLRRARPGDVVLPRLDVLPTLDGVEPGLPGLTALERRGVRLLNGPRSLLAAHDKLQTAFRLASAGVPHPKTALVDDAAGVTGLSFPVVVKPRFGSWGRDVVLCRTRWALRRCLREFGDRPWFRRHGALVQELVPPRGYDLRVVVAAGRVVGSIARIPERGEWRTNVALGGRREQVSPPPGACAAALAAAHAIRGDLVGIDLLPTEAGWTVIEVNGCVDFTRSYSRPGEDVFLEAAGAILDSAQVAAAVDEGALLAPV